MGQSPKSRNTGVINCSLMISFLFSYSLLNSVAHQVYFEVLPRTGHWIGDVEMNKVHVDTAFK